MVELPEKSGISVTGRPSLPYGRLTLPQTPFFIHFVSDDLGIPAWLGDVDDYERDVILLGYGGRLPAADLRKQLIGQLRG